VEPPAEGTRPDDGEDDGDDGPPDPPEADPIPVPGGGWGEVAAVLTAGVLPGIASSVTQVFEKEPAAPPPYWADTLMLTTQSSCTIFIVVYLIHRGGEPWRRFGLGLPRLSDFLLAGPALLVVWMFVWRVRWMLIPSFDPPAPNGFFSLPKGPAEHAMMAIKYAVAAFSEELVTRAYLVTRLEGLLKSQAGAFVLAALAFASYHAYQRTDGLVTTLFLGVAWGVAYLGVRRVWPFAFAHALYNISIELG